MRHLLTVIVALCATFSSWAADRAKPNVVILLVDDLGSGDVSCLFRDVVKTPNIDRLAKQGIKFSSGYSTAPLCGPSRAGFFSGRYQQRFGFNGNGDGIPTNIPLLPGLLKSAGYKTALFGKWHSTGPMPHKRGCFDETLVSATSSPFIDYFHPKLLHNGKVEVFQEYSTDLFARVACEFIRNNAANPFALTVTFNAPHILRTTNNAMVHKADYEAGLAAGKVVDIPKVFTARPGEAARYAAQFPGDTARADTVATIVALDEAVGRILDQLKSAGLEDDTLVFFFADNGGHPEVRSENLPLRDYKWNLFEGGIRVPFLARYPAKWPAGSVFAHPVSSLDILPTCLTAAGIALPAGLDGVDLTPFVNNPTTTPPHENLFFSIAKQAAVRSGKWKYVRDQEGGIHLFDVEADVSETKDLATTEPVLLKELGDLWEKWNQKVRAEAK
jgi:arylsulfatase A-like enzyme